jgi:hypothetical protein
MISIHDLCRNNAMYRFLQLLSFSESYVSLSKTALYLRRFATSGLHYLVRGGVVAKVSTFYFL